MESAAQGPLQEKEEADEGKETCLRALIVVTDGGGVDSTPGPCFFPLPSRDIVQCSACASSNPRCSGPISHDSRGFLLRARHKSRVPLPATSSRT